ncbi:hypothetical protein ILYODFUR_021349 [Ilyodon furcidens]|uniref:Uncharacterized protein n=1 Tax=Ilyodon furcidens TaxID=33524 RepID=A0ABV0U9W5_9TELE
MLTSDSPRGISALVCSSKSVAAAGFWGLHELALRSNDLLPVSYHHWLITGQISGQYWQRTILHLLLRIVSELYPIFSWFPDESTPFYLLSIQ